MSKLAISANVESETHGVGGMLTLCYSSKVALDSHFNGIIDCIFYLLINFRIMNLAENSVAGQNKKLYGKFS